jgi:hypothetical protein
VKQLRVGCEAFDEKCQHHPNACNACEIGMDDEIPLARTDDAGHEPHESRLAVAEKARNDGDAEAGGRGVTRRRQTAALQDDVRSCAVFLDPQSPGSLQKALIEADDVVARELPG